MIISECLLIVLPAFTGSRAPYSWPGGRISIAEPILQDDAFLATALRVRVEKGGTRSQDRLLPLLHRWKAAQYPDTLESIAESPPVNYSERNCRIRA